MTKTAITTAIETATSEAKMLYDQAKAELDDTTIEQSAKAMLQFKIIRVNHVINLLQEAKDNVGTIPGD